MPAGGVTTRTRAVSGISSPASMDRAVRCALDWDRRRRVTPAKTASVRLAEVNRGDRSPRKPGLKLAPWRCSDISKGRAVSGTPTGERARSGGSAQADLSVARSAPAGADSLICVCRRSASFAFFFSCLVGWAKRSAAHADQRSGESQRVGTALRALAHPTKRICILPRANGRGTALSRGPPSPLSRGRMHSVAV